MMREMQCTLDQASRTFDSITQAEEEEAARLAREEALRQAREDTARRLAARGCDSVEHRDGPFTSILLLKMAP